MSPEILSEPDPLKRAQMFFSVLRDATSGPPIEDSIITAEFKSDLDQIFGSLADTELGESGLIRGGNYETISKAFFVNEEGGVKTANESLIKFSILHSTSGFSLPDCPFIFRWMLEVKIEDETWTKFFQDMNGRMGDDDVETGELLLLPEQKRGLTIAGNLGAMILHPSLMTYKT